MPHVLDSVYNTLEPGLLCEAEIENPALVFVSLFADFSVGEALAQTCEMLEVCVTTANETYKYPDQRSRLYAFWKHLNRAMVGGWLLAKARLEALEEYDPND